MILEPKIKVFSGTSHLGLANAIAKYLKMPLSAINLSRFASNEIYARPGESVRNADVFVIQTATENVNEELMELFIMLDAFKRSFANKVHVVMPYFPYARQDRVAAPREPITAKLVADLISKAGADHLITMHLHSDQEQGFFDFPVDNLSVRHLFADYFRKKKLKNVCVVAPDVGSAKECRRLARMLDADLAILNKERRTDVHNTSTPVELVGDVFGKTCIIFDDLVDTAGSVANAASVLKEKGAGKDMYLAAVHPVLSRDAVSKLRKAKFKEIIFTDSVPIAPKKKLANMKIISIAPLFAEVITHVHKGQAVTPLLTGETEYS